MSTEDAGWRYGYARKQLKIAESEVSRAKFALEVAGNELIGLLKRLPHDTILMSGDQAYSLTSLGGVSCKKLVDIYGAKRVMAPEAAPVIDACGCDDHQTERHLAESFVLPDAEAAIDEANANF